MEVSLCDIGPKSSWKDAFFDDSLVIEMVVLNVFDHLKSGAPEASVLYFIHFAIDDFFYSLWGVCNHLVCKLADVLVCDL